MPIFRVKLLHARSYSSDTVVSLSMPNLAVGASLNTTSSTDARRRTGFLLLFERNEMIPNTRTKIRDLKRLTQVAAPGDADHSLTTHRLAAVLHEPVITAQEKPLKTFEVQSGFLTEAETTGFEPAEGFDPFTDLANRRFRPLSHVSRRCNRHQKATRSDRKFEVAFAHSSGILQIRPPPRDIAIRNPWMRLTPMWSSVSTRDIGSARPAGTPWRRSNPRDSAHRRCGPRPRPVPASHKTPHRAPS